MWSESEIIPIVDEDDKIIWRKARSEITVDDIYRVSACWVVDDQGNILLAQRWLHKKHHPWKRWPAVAGTVKKDESYLENIVKEIAEEIGIEVNPQDLILQEKVFKNRDRKHFTQWYLLVYRWDKTILRPEPWAVEQLKWFTPDELVMQYHSTPEIFLTSMEYTLRSMHLI